MMNDSDRLLVQHTEDAPATRVYGDLLFRHHKACREHGSESPEAMALFTLTMGMRNEYPAECKVWEDRYAK